MPTRVLIAFLLLLAAAAARSLGPHRFEDRFEETIYLDHCESGWYASETSKDSIHVACYQPSEPPE